MFLKWFNKYFKFPKNSNDWGICYECSHRYDAIQLGDKSKKRFKGEKYYKKKLIRLKQLLTNKIEKQEIKVEKLKEKN